MEIKQLRDPGRESPYITIIDTGLAVAAQNFLASLLMGVLEGADLQASIDQEGLEELVNRLAKELESRTF